MVAALALTVELVQRFETWEVLLPQMAVLLALSIAFENTILLYRCVRSLHLPVVAP